MFVYISSTWTAVHTLDCSSLMASLFSIYHSNPVYCSRSTLVYVVQTTLKRRALPREQARCADLRLEPPPIGAWRGCIRCFAHLRSVRTIDNSLS
jgi:hypothetical protein